MSVKSDLRAFILNDAAIAAIISTRCYSFPAPQKDKEYPYLMLSRIFENPGRNLVAPNERYRESWQIDCYAETDDAAESLKELVRERVDVCAPFTMGSYSVLNMFVEDSADLSELELKGGEDGIYRKQMELIIIRKKTPNP
jgi:hypothetical protein